MKRMIFCVAAAVAAVAAVADDSSKWYSPSKGDWKGGKTGKLTVFDVNEEGEWINLDYEIDQYGNIEGWDEYIKDLKEDGVDAITLMALYAAKNAAENSIKIDNMAKNLESKVVTSAEKKTKDGQTTLTFKMGYLGKTDAKATDEKTMSATIDTYSIQKDEDSLFYLKKNGNKDNGSVQWASGTVPDNKSVGEVQVGSIFKTQIYGWNTHNTGEANSIADKISATTEDTSSRVLVYNGGYVNYWRLGKLSSSGSFEADEHSITTNAPGYVGKAALVGFHDVAANGSVPFANGENLGWTGMASAGALLAADQNSTPEWSTTDGADMYYGTGHNGGGMGWKVLPNVTTNSIEADDITIREYHPDGEVTRKLIGWKNVPPVDNKPYCILGVQMQGGVGYSFTPLTDAISNNVNVAVDDASINTNSAGQLQIYNWADLADGFVMRSNGKASTRLLNVANPLFLTETETDVSVGLTNWNNAASTCDATLTDMLTGQNDAEKSKHRLLAQYDGSDLHYVPLGDIISVKNDKTTISTNETGHVGELALAGFYTAAANQVPYKTDAGTLGWKFAGGSGAFRFTTDGLNGSSGDVTIGSGSETNTVTFASETDSNIKFTVTKPSDNAVTIKIGFAWTAVSGE